jgi:hypothetical protein
VYYLSKYYELLDTVLQLLKGRPPPHFFLHVYHHATVLVMALGLGLVLGLGLGLGLGLAPTLTLTLAR